MKNNLLLPHKYKRIGWFVLIPALVISLFVLFLGYDALEWKATVFVLYSDEFMGESQSFAWINTNIVNTVLGVLLILGGLLVAFSKEKREDEYIASLRLTSLLWAVLLNSLLLLFAFLFFYGLIFINVMLFNMFTTLLIFIVRFNYVLYRDSKIAADEK